MGSRLFSHFLTRAISPGGNSAHSSPPPLLALHSCHDRLHPSCHHDRASGRCRADRPGVGRRAVGGLRPGDRPITSIYRWHGQIETAQEWQCWAKSRRDLYDRIEQTIRRLHPYEVPENLGHAGAGRKRGLCGVAGGRDEIRMTRGTEEVVADGFRMRNASSRQPPPSPSIRAWQSTSLFDHFLDDLDEMGAFLRLAKVGGLLFGLLPLAVLEQRNARMDWLKTPQNALSRTSLTTLARLFRLAGAFFAAFGSAAPARSAVSFSSRNSLRFNILRAMFFPQTRSKSVKPAILSDLPPACQSNGRKEGRTAGLGQ